MAASDRTHYDILGIARDADATEVRRAWKLLVQVWHPDRFTGDMCQEAERHTARINEAYHALRDSSRRAAYDCRLAADDRDDERTTARNPVRPTRVAQGTGAAPRVAATQIAVPRSSLQQLGEDTLAAIRRHPRIIAGAVAVWFIVFGSSAVLHVFAGPSAPAGVSTVRAASASPAAREVAGSQDMPQLEELAAQARAEAAAANDELEAMLEEDATAAAPPVEAAPRAGEAEARATPGASGGRILRVMPASP